MVRHYTLSEMKSSRKKKATQALQASTSAKIFFKTPTHEDRKSEENPSKRK